MNRAAAACASAFLLGALGCSEGDRQPDLLKYGDESSEHYRSMVDIVKRKMGITTLQYQKLPDMVKAIGLPKEKLCTYCWDGCEGPCSQKKGKK